MNDLTMMGKNERLLYVIDNIGEFDESERLSAFQDAYYAADIGFECIEINKVKHIFKNHAPQLPKEIQDQEYVTVYRGGTEYGVFYGRALSWTLDFDIAEFFANREPRESNMRYVARAKIQKKYILDYANNRNEREVLLLPEELEDIELIPFTEKEWTEEERLTALQILYVQSQN